MKLLFKYFAIHFLFLLSCRETIGDQPSKTDLEMEKRIVGYWIFDNGNPPVIDSTILYFDLTKAATIIDYGVPDTLDSIRFKIRDSVLTLIFLSSYPILSEIDYRIDFLNDLYLTISRYYPIPYSKTYRKYYVPQNTWH